MITVNPIRALQSRLANIPITDGNLIFTTSGQNCYIDVGKARYKIGDMIVVTNHSTITNPQSDKIYLESTTGELYIVDPNHNNQLKCVGGRDRDCYTSRDKNYFFNIQFFKTFVVI